MKTIGIIYHFTPIIGCNNDTDTSRQIQFNFHALNEEFEIVASGTISEIITTNQILFIANCHTKENSKTRNAVERFRLLNEDENNESLAEEEANALHEIMQESVEYCLNESVNVKAFKELQV